MSQEPDAEPSVDEAPIGFDVLRTAVGLLPPVALITGLLFYFGWVRVRAIASALGQSDSVYGYTTTDFVLRSVGSLFFPLLVLTAMALVAVVLHQQVQRALRAGNADWAEPAALVLIVLGIGLLVYGALFALVLYEAQASLREPTGQVSPGVGALLITGPLSLGVGALLVTYGTWLRAASRRGPGGIPVPTWQRAFAAGMLMCLCALSLFWAVGNYAQVRGVQDAQLIEAGYRQFPAVIVYAAKDLGLEPDAAVQPSTVDNARYRFQYSCLRLLDHVDGTWYLLPENWAFNHRLIMLDDDPDLRFELTGVAGEAPCPGME